MQKRAVETREAIVLAAAEAFSAAGYRSTTLRDIIHRAGLTLGALYFHFDSKQALANDIIERQHAASIETLQCVLNADESGISSMVRLSSLLAEQILTDPIVRAGLRLSTDSVDELATATATPYRDWIAGCRLLLERARAQGETRAGLDLDAAAELVISAFSGTQFLAATFGRSHELVESLTKMWPILLVGIVAENDHPAIANTRSLLDTRALV